MEMARADGSTGRLITAERATRRTGLAAMVPALLLLAAAGGARAQDTLPPAQGGYVRSLGLPEIFKPYAGLGLGLSREEGRSHLSSQLYVGVFRDIGSPVTHVLGVGVEGYGALRDVRPSYGLRALLVSHLLGVGVGLDYDVRANAGALIVALAHPVRRGGIIGRGSGLRLDWVPARSSVSLAVTLPVRQTNRGSTRPARDYVRLRDSRPRPMAFVATDPTLVDALARVRESAGWINRVTVPSLGRPGGDPRRAAAAAAEPLKARLALRSMEEEIRTYHGELARAFSIAVSGDPQPPGAETELGAQTAARAREILLRRVLFPYNALLGQRKREDTTREFGGHARGAFARWLTTESEVPADRTEAALHVFQALLAIVEEVRAANRETWGDARLVWLPLQLALRPEEYDEQVELDSLLSRAVGRSITHGNRIWYVHNDRFQQELIKSIDRAREYHILWVHDFRGVTDQGRPDRLSLLLVTQAYLNALRDRVAEYDTTGRLPAYMVFLDQHYFERNRSRPLLDFLQDPLGSTLEFPAGFDSLQRAVAEAQDALRRAVDASKLLRAERAQYGEGWLRRLIRVHVSVTNPADPSFRSRQIVPLVGMPDDAMRDHRKIVLYDVSEEDPYRGIAMNAGMGVGEHYAGPAWEDRAIMLQGPAALAVRDEARALLEVQGIRNGALPHVLRPHLKPADYDRRVRAVIDSMDALGEVASRAIALHNATGFGPKHISVADATLFNLLSPGGVVKVPDSLWLNELLASLLTGAALRGVRVLVIAPSLASAPAPGFGMPLMHDLLARLGAMRVALAPELARTGGLLRTGLYNPQVGVDNLEQRVRAFRSAWAASPFLREFYRFDETVEALLDSADVILGTADGDVPRHAADDAVVLPKLHFKGFVYVSGVAWHRLISGPPMALGFREYLRQRVQQIQLGAAVEEFAMADAMQKVGALVINPVLDSVSASERSRWVFFLQVGSSNQDYRSMVMDGEGAVVVSGWTSLYAVPDFVLLTGLVRWIDDPSELDRLLPPPGGLKKRLARWVRMAL